MKSHTHYTPLPHSGISTGKPPYHDPSLSANSDNEPKFLRTLTPREVFELIGQFTALLLLFTLFWAFLVMTGNQ